MTDAKMIPAHDIKEDHKYKFTCDTLDEFLLGGHCPYMQTSSLVYRNVFLNNKTVYNYLKSHMYSGDLIRTMLHATRGKMKFINELMSVYRISGQGCYTELTDTTKNILHINFYRFHKKNTFLSKYSVFFEKLIIKEAESLLKKNTDIFLKAKYLTYLYYYKVKSYLISKIKPQEDIQLKLKQNLDEENFLNE
jgi:hypothetical protein